MLEEAGAENRKRALLARSAHERCIRIWAKAGLHLSVAYPSENAFKFEFHLTGCALPQLLAAKNCD